MVVYFVSIQEFTRRYIIYLVGEESDKKNINDANIDNNIEPLKNIFKN